MKLSKYIILWFAFFLMDILLSHQEILEAFSNQVIKRTNYKIADSSIKVKEKKKIGLLIILKKIAPKL